MEPLARWTLRPSFPLRVRAALATSSSRETRPHGRTRTDSLPPTSSEEYDNQEFGRPGPRRSSSDLFLYRVSVGHARSTKQDVVDPEWPSEPDVDETQVCVRAGDQHRCLRFAPSRRARDGDPKHAIGYGVHASVDRRGIAGLLDPLRRVDAVGADFPRKDGLDLPLALEHPPVAVQGVRADDVASAVEPDAVVNLVPVLALRDEKDRPRIARLA